MPNYEFQGSNAIRANVNAGPLAQIEHDLSLKLYSFNLVPSLIAEGHDPKYYMVGAEIAVPVEVLLDIGATDPIFLEAAQQDTMRQLTQYDSPTARDIAASMAGVSITELPRFSGVRIHVVWTTWSELYWSMKKARVLEEEIHNFPDAVNKFIDSYLPAHDETVAAYMGLPGLYKGNLERSEFRISAADAVLRYALTH